MAYISDSAEESASTACVHGTSSNGPPKGHSCPRQTKSVPGVQMEETLRRSGHVFLVARSKGQLGLLGS